jgi:hypothetical protein
MLDLQIVLLVSLVFLIWVVAIVFLRNVGPGRVWRSVRCPEKQKQASLVVLYHEPLWGRLEAADVSSCSLLEGPVTCSKQCLARL